MDFASFLTRDFYDVTWTRWWMKRSVRNFIKTYYYCGRRTWQDTTWLGVSTLKAPTDLWVYQELLCKLRPDYVIETGTYRGGSGLYLATVCEAIGHGCVITVDIKACDTVHPRLVKVVDPRGSTHPDVVHLVSERVGRAPCMVILDSTHRKAHVLAELRAYAPFVPVGGYLVVEDTCLGGYPVLPSWGDGPYDAVKEFVRDGDFDIDRSREKFLLTLNPNGFLRRVRGQPEVTRAVLT